MKLNVKIIKIKNIKLLILLHNENSLGQIKKNINPIANQQTKTIYKFKKKLIMRQLYLLFKILYN